MMTSTKRWNTALGLALACICGLSQAQGKPNAMPSQADMAAKQKQILETLGKLPSGNAVANTQKQVMDSNAAAANAAFGQSRQTLPAQTTRADFEMLARQAQGQQPAQQQAKRTSDLMIFVSMSMPEQMLMNYAVQAKRFGAVLMLRGFIDDKLSVTRQVLSRLNRAGAQFEVSPEPFKHFKINKVPAIVMATADSGSITEEGCAKPETYTAVFGDITVLDALDKISLRGQPQIASLAKARLMADRAAGKRGE